MCVASALSLPVMFPLLLFLLATIASAVLAESSSSSTGAVTATAATATATATDTSPTSVCTAWTYTLTHNNTTPTPLAPDNTTTTNLPPADDAVAPFNFNFNFTFYGQTYTSVNVSTNGNLQFTTSSVAWIDSTFPLNFSSTSAQPLPPAISSYYVDLNPDQVWMQQVTVQGQPPYRRAVVRYSGVPVCPFDQDTTHNDTQNDTSLIDSQPTVSCDVVLYEIDSRIVIQYYNIDPTPWPVSVGVQGGEGTAAGWTAAVDHQSMNGSIVQWLANCTLTFMPECSEYRYRTVSSTGDGRGPQSSAANGASTLQSGGWNIIVLWIVVISLVFLWL